MNNKLKIIIDYEREQISYIHILDDKILDKVSKSRITNHLKLVL
jgi:hypothetical protein